MAGLPTSVCCPPYPSIPWLLLAVEFCFSTPRWGEHGPHPRLCLCLCGWGLEREPTSWHTGAQIMAEQTGDGLVGMVEPRPPFSVTGRLGSPLGGCYIGQG